MSLVTIYKSFKKTQLDYLDAIFDKPNNATFSNGVESTQYNAISAITRTIRGTSKEKLCQEPGSEALKERRWSRILCCLYKIIEHQVFFSAYFPSQASIILQKTIPKFVSSFTEQKVFLPYTIRERTKHNS